MNSYKKIIGSLFPDTVSVAGGLICEFQGHLLPEEEKAVYRAIERRKKEFIAGRTCARIALKELGAQKTAIPQREDRSPVWPKGIVGSITHTHDICGAAVGSTLHHKAIGIDIEETSRLKRGSFSYICTKDEIERMRGISERTDIEQAALIFSAKEAFFKLQYQITGQWLELNNVEIIYDLRAGIFTVNILKDIYGLFSKGVLLKGKYTFFDKYIFTGIVL